MNIGHYQCEALETGQLLIKGAGMFAGVPPRQWRRHFHLDAEERVPFAVRTLLIRGGGRLILVDTGNGNALPEQLAHEYGIDQHSHGLLRELGTKGIRPDSVTHVILTHLHFDHAGGALFRKNDGSMTPAFPKAIHYVQRKQYEAAVNPVPEEKDAYRQDQLRLLSDSVQFVLLQGSGEPLSGITVETADGHTPGQQYVRVAGADTANGGESLLFPADVIPTAAHLRVPWFTAFDLTPKVAVKEKRRLIEQAAADGSIVVFDHDPKIAAATVRLAARPDSSITTDTSFTSARPSVGDPLRDIFETDKIWKVQ